VSAPAAYYNENDAYAAQWLRNLIDAGHIAPGVVDERSIVDVRAADLAGFVQCHFFAGIGGWSLALRLAGWPDARPVWTGSCPCQPFSGAGQRRGFADERHLWPAWFRLLEERRPRRVYGEQVADRAALRWWDAVRADLEHAQYACAAADLCAAGVGAPHIRQRLYWLADDDDGCKKLGLAGLFDGERPAQWHDVDGRGAAGWMDDTDGGDSREARIVGGQRSAQSIAAGRLDDAERERLRGGRRAVASFEPDEPGDRPVCGAQSCQEPRQAPGRTGLHAPRGFWSPCEWIDCRDGKRRPIEPGTFPLAHGVPGRVGRLRAYGNAIVSPLAAVFIRATMAGRSP
jgi:DNA (cytosine-5)-methyltransferase 1